MSRKYVAVNYDSDTQKNLRDWCHQNGFDLTVSYSGEIKKPEDFVFHTTIFYTSNDVGDVDAEFPEKMKRKTKAVGFELFGKDKNVPVLIVEKTAGLNLLRTWYEDLGFQDEWPDWKPHISISYAPTLPIIEHLSLPTFDLVYDVVHVEDIKDEV